VGDEQVDYVPFIAASTFLFMAWLS